MSNSVPATGNRTSPGGDRACSSEHSGSTGDQTLADAVMRLWYRKVTRTIVLAWS